MVPFGSTSLRGGVIDRRDAEQQVVRDVAAGTIELGSVDTSVFDTLGDSATFEALTAPMLIDNNPLPAGGARRATFPPRCSPGSTSSASSGWP